MPVNQWLKTVVLPIVVILGVMLFYSALFTLRTGAPILPSFLALRAFAFFMIGPLVYLMYRSGIPARELANVFIAAASFAVLIYIIAYLALPLEAYRFSRDPRLAGLVAADDWRGVRLKGPMYLFIFLFSYYGHKLFTRGNVVSVPTSLLWLPLLVVIFAINMSRAAMVNMAIGFVVYYMFVGGSRRLQFSVLSSPIVIIAAAIVLPVLVDMILFSHRADWSLITRLESIRIALTVFEKYPIVGIGQASNFSISYHDLFGDRFFASDIGMFGILLRFGLAGVVLYLAFGAWLFLRLLSIHLSPAVAKRDPMVWTLVLTLTIMLIASVTITAVLISTEGIPISAFAFGMILIYRYPRHADLGHVETSSIGPAVDSYRPLPPAYQRNIQPGEGH